MKLERITPMSRQEFKAFIFGLEVKLNILFSELEQNVNNKNVSDKEIHRKTMEYFDLQDFIEMFKLNIY